jgi:hypothetical protein
VYDLARYDPKCNRQTIAAEKLTILASVGVFLPLLVLTYMQYRSLAELQSKTKGAFKDNLRQGLTYVEHQMKQRLEGVCLPAIAIRSSMPALTFKQTYNPTCRRS